MTVTRAPGRDGMILLLEALTVTVIIAHDPPTAGMTCEALVDGRERAETGGEVVIRDPAAVVRTIGVEEADRPTAATIGIHAGVSTRSDPRGSSGGGGGVVIPDDLVEDMTIARCEVRRLPLEIAHPPLWWWSLGRRFQHPHRHQPATRRLWSRHRYDSGRWYGWSPESRCSPGQSFASAGCSRGSRRRIHGRQSLSGHSPHVGPGLGRRLYLLQGQHPTGSLKYRHGVEQHTERFPVSSFGCLHPEGRAGAQRYRY